MAADRPTATIPSDALNAFRVISLMAALYLVAVLYAEGVDREEAAEALGPTYATLYVVLMLTLAWAARRGWWRWRFVATVGIFGPLASVPGLESIRLAQRH